MKIELKRLGELEMEQSIRSIFDISVAGQITVEGNYYIIHKDYRTNELYALSKETEKEVLDMGYALDNNQEAVFNGEKVRAMTFEEERAYNEDNLLLVIDLWGNVAVDSDSNDNIQTIKMYERYVKL